MPGAESQQLDRETVVAIEKTMLQVPGVGSVRVVVDEAGEIQEIHALTDASRTPKQVARDFESLLQARFGIAINHRKISIAQLGDEPKAPGPPPRLTIRALELRNEGLRTSVRVELADVARVGSGLAEGPSSVSNKLRLVAVATLRALEAFTGDAVQYVLEDVHIERVARREVVVSCVSLIGPKGEESLLGTCQVGRDETEATIRATLSALNRRLGRIMVRTA